MYFTKGEDYVFEDGHGQHQSGSSSIMIMLIKDPISTQGERYVIEDGHG